MHQTNHPINRDHTWWIDLFWIGFGLTFIYALFLGTRPLFVPDEGRYAEIAREMVANGDYITPYLNGIKYFEKPILFYWLSAAMIKIGGLNLWALRTTNVLLGVICCLNTYWTTRTLYDRTTGVLAALLLGSSTLFCVMSHMISLDLPVTVFLTLCLNAFLLAIHQPPSRHRHLLLLAAATFAACAVLIKGLIGIVFPCLIVGAWIALMNEWRLLRHLYLPTCILVFLLVAAPWHLLVGQRNPEFYYFYFIKQHFLRYTMLKVGHYQPVWFFIPNLIIGFFPWIMLLPQAIKNALPTTWSTRREKSTELFFLLWAVIIFAFFSFSKSKLIPYIVPVMPPLAMLVAIYVRKALNQPATKGMKFGFCFMAAFAIAVSALLIYFPRHSRLPDPETATLYLTIAAALLSVGFLLACLAALNNKILRAIVIAIVTNSLFLVIIQAAMPAIDTRTILPLANIIKQVAKPDEEIIAYNQYYQDLPFYLQRRVTILNWKNEMSYGMQHQDTREWMITDLTFWQRWHGPKRVFAMMGTVDYDRFKHKYINEKSYSVAVDMNNILITNQPLNTTSNK